jgi:hypothetical protein
VSLLHAVGYLSSVVQSPGSKLVSCGVRREIVWEEGRASESEKQADIDLVFVQQRMSMQQRMCREVWFHQEHFATQHASGLQMAFKAESHGDSPELLGMEVHKCQVLGQV